MLNSNLLLFPGAEYMVDVTLHCTSFLLTRRLSKSQIDQIEAIQRRALTIIYTYANDMPYTNALYCASIPSLVDRREQLSRKFFYINLTILILSSYPFTYPSGSYNYNSIKICKQISTPPQPYQKIPHIFFLRPCPLPNFISILSPITIQFVFDVFALYVLCNFYCTALLCYLTTKLNKLYYDYCRHVTSLHSAPAVDFVDSSSERVNER